MKEFDYDYDINLENIKEKFIKPNDFIIPEESIKIHGITQEIANKKGKNIEKILNKFGNIINDCDYIIGYNVFFDVSILESELYRIKLNNIINKIEELKLNKQILCIGILSSKYAKPDQWKPHIRNKYQIPKQIEVYKKCFNVYPENSHNAKSDVLTMIRIIFWIFEKYIINDAINDIIMDNKYQEINDHLINKSNLTLNILSYNLFYGEDKIQIDYINHNNFDILFLQETTEYINDNLNNYIGDISQSHCGYTYLGINKNLKFEKLGTIKIKGNVINHLKINNIELIIGSLNLSPHNIRRDEQIYNINKILRDNNFNNLPIIFGGDTNMLDKHTFISFNDVYLIQNNNKYYLTYPNREFKDNRIISLQKNNYRYDRFFIKNCNCNNFETIPNSNSDHLAIKTFITINK